MNHPGVFSKILSSGHNPSSHYLFGRLLPTFPGFYGPCLPGHFSGSAVSRFSPRSPGPWPRNRKFSCWMNPAPTWT